MNFRLLMILCGLTILTGASALAAPAPDGAGQLSNSKMTAIYDADQADRADWMHIDWSKVSKSDAARRIAVTDMLAKGELHSGLDFHHAAFVFQHGDTADDILMAHTLAMVAVKKGDQDAIWIASAALDRYLQRIGQPQIYGTQYTKYKSSKNKPTTQEPYNRTLISDALRLELGVPSIKDQEAQRIAYDKGN